MRRGAKETKKKKNQSRLNSPHKLFYSCAHQREGQRAEQCDKHMSTLGMEGECVCTEVGEKISTMMCGGREMYL